MANIALQDGKVVLKDGKASCTCCGGIICPDIELEYDVISEAMYNALLDGGDYVVNGTLTESPCNLNETKSGLTAGCNQLFFVENKTCDDPGNSIFQYASLSIGISIAQVGGEYRLTYTGNGLCPSFMPNFGCYSIGYYISWLSDNETPGYFVNVGSVTINTSAGTLGPYGIWSIAPFGSGSLDVTITPFLP
jgi:hypothetical protein